MIALDADPRTLPEPDRAFLDAFAAFLSDVDAERIERDDKIPAAVVDGLRELGAFAIRIPREYGGLGLSYVCYLRALMLAGAVHAALSELLAGHQAIGVPQPVLRHGTPEQRRHYLPRCVREISAFALTEPDLGNDPAGVRTTAVPQPGGTYTLNGTKLWVTNGTVAEMIVVLADVHGAGCTAFVVETALPGVTVGPRGAFLGLRGLENGVLRLHDVTVDAGARIGAEGAGLQVALDAQETSRLSLPAVGAAVAGWALGAARAWAGTRRQFGKPIGAHDAIAGKLAVLAASAFTLEAMVEVTARTGDGYGAELTKLYAADRVWQIADDLVQIRGGRGYETAASASARGETGVPAERVLRDVRVHRIFDGSGEVLRVFLSTDLGKFASTLDFACADPRLAGHHRFVRDTAARLAAELGRAPGEDAQRHLGRLVDIGAELYAIAAGCVYAQALGDDPAVELADLAGRHGAVRVHHLWSALARHTDERDRAAAARVLDGRYRFLEVPR